MSSAALFALFAACSAPGGAKHDDSELVAASRAEAKAALQRGDPQAAVVTLTRAVPLAPDDADLWNDLGLAWLAAGGPDSAQASFQHSIRLAPGRAPAHLNLAVLLMRRGATGRAQTEFDDAVRAEPGNALLYWNFAVALTDVGKLDAARANLEHALALDPSCGPAHAEMGRVEVQAGRAPEALPYFARAESLGVHSATVTANYGLALLRAGRFADAEAQLARAVQMDSTRAPVWGHLAIARLRQGETAAAIDAWQRARRLAPRDEDIRFNLGSALLRLERYHDAAAVLSEPRPTRPDLLGALGMARRGEGRLPEALALLRQAAEGAPRDVVILNNYGVVRAESGDVPGALEVWHRVLDIEPGNRTAQENIAAQSGGGTPSRPPR
jgi:protein O-GlcNAc transferase